MLTIFAIPKPFKGHIAIIQRNAITSWTLLRPRPEIILFGDDDGTVEVAHEFGLRHVPQVARNEYGTPLFNDFFEKAQQAASRELLCYVNADMILMSGFMEAMKHARAWVRPFLLVGGRWGVNITEAWDFDAFDWEQRLRTLVRARGAFSYWGIDYFAFPRGLYKGIPPLAIGRGYFDGWLIWKARTLKAAIVDATPVVLAVHQNHDYSHVSAKDGSVWLSEEGKRNHALAGFPQYRFLLEATHRLTHSGLSRAWGRKLLLFFEYLYVYRLGQARHKLGLRRKNFARMKYRILSIFVHT